MFHRVLAATDPLLPGLPDARRFRHILRVLKRMYRILPLADALALIRNDKLPSASAAITFDDGYADNYTVALPILMEEKVSATIYVATKYLDGGRMFNDTIWEALRETPCDGVDLSCLGLSEIELHTWEQKRAAAHKVVMALKYMQPEKREVATSQVVEALKVEPRTDLMMSSENVAALPRSIITVGAHTHSHPILTRIEPAAAERDIAEGRRILQGIVGEAVDLFAYPNGKPGEDYDGRHVQMIRAMGFSSAVTTSPGVHVKTGDFYQIPRFTPWHSDAVRFSLMMLHNALAINPRIVDV